MLYICGLAEKERAYSWFIEKEEQSNSVVVLLLLIRDY